MMKIPRLLEVTSNYLTDGIFNMLSVIPGIPWEVESTLLDAGYYLNNSGNKRISPFVKNIMGENKILTDENMMLLANYISARYLLKWQKLYDTLSLEYNPINNYDMTEEIIKENRKILSGTNNSTFGHGEIVQSTGNQNNNRFGFNSVASVGDTTHTVTGTETHSGNDTENRTTSESENDNEESTLKRSGNIGVTTTQQMISSERELWLWDFFKIVFADLDSVLTLQVY